MSFLSIDEIRGKTSGTPTDVNDLKYQLATAWVNFDGQDTVAIRDSYNVSSITDRGVGLYTVNFATAMDSADYCVQGTTSDIGDGANIVLNIDDANALTTSGVRMENRASNSTRYDPRYGFVAIFGGLN